MFGGDHESSNKIPWFRNISTFFSITTLKLAILLPLGIYYIGL